MSSVPPPPPPPVAPPPAEGTGRPPIPWEQRPQVPFFDALVQNVQLFVTNPTEAFSRTREKGDFAGPLLYAVCISWVGIVFSTIWSLVIGNPFVKFLPPAMAGRMAAGAAMGVVSAMFRIILSPIFVVIALFIGAGILHVCFLIVGGMSQSTAGFEGTFRILCYAAVANLANVVPLIGGLIGAIWQLVLVVMGAVALHRMSQGKAIAGVLIPVVLCCLCVAVAFVAGMATVMSLINK